MRTLLSADDCVAVAGGNRGVLCEATDCDSNEEALCISMGIFCVWAEARGVKESIDDRVTNRYMDTLLSTLSPAHMIASFTKTAMS